MNVRSKLGQIATATSVAMALYCSAGASLAQTSPTVDLAAQVGQVVQDMNRTAVQAARLIGKPAVSQITCDQAFIVCTCSNVFDCAWLSWYCGKFGGVGGFNGECYLPGSMLGMTSVLSNAKRVASLAAARQ